MYMCISLCMYRVAWHGISAETPWRARIVGPDNYHSVHTPHESLCHGGQLRMYGYTYLHVRHERYLSGTRPGPQVSGSLSVAYWEKKKESLGVQSDG